jgi:hypothetical protein
VEEPAARDPSFHSVDITAKNVGSTVTGHDVWMTWLTTS